MTEERKISYCFNAVCLWRAAKAVTHQPPLPAFPFRIWHHEIAGFKERCSSRLVQHSSTRIPSSFPPPSARPAFLSGTNKDAGRRGLGERLRPRPPPLPPSAPRHLPGKMNVCPIHHPAIPRGRKPAWFLKLPSPHRGGIVGLTGLLFCGLRCQDFAICIMD